MGSEWPISSLGETCYITDGAHSKVERQKRGVPYLTSKNLGQGNLKLDNVDYISESDFQRLFTNTARSQRRLRSGDILTGIIGTFGNAYRYKDVDHFGISSSGSTCLRNRLGITDTQRLSKAEAEFTSVTLAELIATPIEPTFDLTHLRKIHRHVFGDVYSWAGELR